MKTRIYIGTASGPVQVERIWREEGIAESMVCLKRTTEILPIGAGYDAFVKRPSGVVERAFGPFEAGGFRLELSDRINQGTSWQLAVFIAHALARDGQLAGPEDDFTRAVWLTGQVDHDLQVGGVDQVPEKIHAALDPLEALVNEGKEVFFFVPEHNAQALSGALIPAGIDARSATSAIDVLHALGISLESGASEAPAAEKPAATKKRATQAQKKGEPPDQHRTKRALVGTAFLVIGGGAIAAGIILPEIFIPDEPAPEIIEAIQEKIAESEAQPTPEPEPAAAPAKTSPKTAAEDAPAAPAPKVTISEIRAAPGSGCPAVHFGANQGIASELTPTSAGNYASMAGAEICALAFTVAPTPERPYLALAIELISGRYVEIEPLPAALKGAEPVSTPLTWRINLPLAAKSPLEYRLQLLSAENPIIAETVKSLQTGNFSAPGQPGTSLTTARHSVAP